MHLNDSLKPTEDEMLFFNRPDWKIKKDLREVSTMRKIFFYLVHAFYFSKGLKLYKELASTPMPINEKKLNEAERHLSKVQKKINTQIKNYVKLTKKILNIKENIERETNG